MSRILLAFPESTEAKDLRLLLEAAGDEVRVSASREETLRLLEESPVEGVLFDLRLCERGADLRRSLAALREAGAVALVVAAAPVDLNRLEPDLPLDDFLIAPWQPAEAQARLRYVLWRSSNIKDDNLIKCGDLVIDLASYQVHLGGVPVLLTYKEYELLRFLASNRGRVFTRDALLNRIWGYDYYGGGRTVDVHIRRLRSKIEIGGRAFIDTVRNVGYRFAEKS